VTCGPERLHLLPEAIESVYAQTLRPADIAIGIDYSSRGEVWNANRLLEATNSEWVAFLHDDDLWDPDHLAACSESFDTADVVVSRYRLVGRPPSTIEPWHEDFADLRWTQWIGSPSMVVARRSVFGWWVGGNKRYHWNDWAQWNHLLDTGARFADTHRVTTSYRFMGGNGSWHA
jgi:glycosyltransferase involved in cell wall biosynthesis